MGPIQSSSAAVMPSTCTTPMPTPKSSSPARTCDGARSGDLGEVVSYQSVGRLECGLRFSAIHRDADIGVGQRRRVVDGIADHRHEVSWACSLAIAATLSSGIRLARTSSTPGPITTGFAVAKLSPVSMTIA